MTIIDFTAQMVPVWIGVVALLAMAVAGIGSCLDDREREESRGRGQRVGAWWAGRGRASKATSLSAFDLTPNPTDAWLARRLFTSPYAAE
jgi:O-methyltransferase involved in polyketide biosynthesis